MTAATVSASSPTVSDAPAASVALPPWSTMKVSALALSPSAVKAPANVVVPSTSICPAVPGPVTVYAPGTEHRCLFWSGRAAGWRPIGRIVEATVHRLRPCKVTGLSGETYVGAAMGWVVVDDEVQAVEVLTWRKLHLISAVRTSKLSERCSDRAWPSRRSYNKCRLNRACRRAQTR